MGDSPGYDTDGTAIFNAWVLRLWPLSREFRIRYSRIGYGVNWLSSWPCPRLDNAIGWE
jgi:hypothetical protein